MTNSSELYDEVHRLVWVPTSALSEAHFSPHREPVSVTEAQIALARLIAQSITYRWDSVLFHRGLLNDMSRAYQEMFQDGVAESDRRPLLRQAVTHQAFLLDDIVLLIVSAFDFLGNLCGTCLAAERHGQLKWAGFLNLAREAQRNPRGHLTWVADSAAAAHAAAINDAWLRGLASYRGAMIHSRREAVDGEVRYHLTPGADAEVTLSSHAPSSLLEALPILRDSTTAHPSATAVADRLVELTHHGLCGVGLALYLDLRAKLDLPVRRDLGWAWLPQPAT